VGLQSTVDPASGRRVFAVTWPLASLDHVYLLSADEENRIPATDKKRARGHMDLPGAPLLTR